MTYGPEIRREFIELKGDVMDEKKRLRLVRKGLRQIVGNASAGACADITGQNCQAQGGGTCPDCDAQQAAIDWLYAVLEKRGGLRI